MALDRGTEAAPLRSRSRSGETADRRLERRDVAGRLRAELAKLSTRKAAADVGAAPRDAELSAALASLGYAAGGTRRAGTIDPRDGLALFARFTEAKRRLAAGDAASARDQLAALVRESPGSVPFWTELAAAERAAGELTRSISTLERALALNPDLEFLHLRRGDALAEAGRRDEAERALRRALAIDPRFAAAWLALAELEAKAGRPAEEERALRGAVAAGTESAGVLARLGQIELARGDLAAADPHLAAACRLLPEWPLPWELWARLAERQGRPEVAAERRSHLPRADRALDGPGRAERCADLIVSAAMFSGFHPVVRRWFEEAVGVPTEIQALAWPAIAAGEHVLISAPTGCGKTLAAFLWAIDRLATGAWTGGTTRVVYVSPLKALNADVERNLLGPLAEVERRFATAGVDSAPIRVATRSGDTPASERQKLLRRPPEILITTPESLNLLLLSKAARRIFAGVTCVLLDEIHAVAGSKRGTHLITAVDRLVRLAGEFQRVALSATVRPLDEVAAFVGGLRLERGEGGEPRHVPRAVRVLASHEAKRYDLTVRLAPASDDPDALDDAFWTRLAADIRPRLAAARSTLIFTNSRRMAERFTRELNAGEAREVAWSHHGSLAREIRQAVERRLKEGQLPALVATSSLELGIDVGALDQVLLVQTPRAVASAAQRIGRAGHRVGEVSRGVFFPTHPRDLLQAAVVARAVAEREIEPLRVVRNPLDVLAQVILGMLAAESWEVDGLFLAVRTSDPYRDLPRRQFDLVLEMLAGRYAESRIAELRPRIAIDRLTGRATARAGLVRELAERGGTIPDRGYFQLRLEDSRAKLGELDEEFVWERSLGDVFTLGAQSWRIRGITHNDVLVAPARGGPPLAPFWRADEQDRDFFLSEKIGQFLERADGRLDEARFASELESEHALEPPAAAELVRLLREQRIATGTSLPHRRHLLVELSEERVHDASRRQIVLYTLWGGRVNRPLAHALAAAWEEGAACRSKWSATTTPCW